MLALVAHGHHVLHPRAGYEQAGLRVARAERPQALDLLGEVERERPAGHDRVHVLAAAQVGGAQRRPGVGGESAPERLHRAACSSTPAATR